MDHVGQRLALGQRQVGVAVALLGEGGAKQTLVDLQRGLGHIVQVGPAHQRFGVLALAGDDEGAFRVDGGGVGVPDLLAVLALQRSQRHIVGLVVARRAGQAPAQEGAHRLVGRADLCDVDAEIVGEALGVDQVLLVQAVEPLDGVLVRLGDRGVDHLAVLHDEVVVVVVVQLAEAAEHREQAVLLAVVQKAEGDLIGGAAVAVHVVVAESLQGVLKLLQRGGQRQAQLVQPGLVDEQLVVGLGRQLGQAGQAVDVAVRRGERLAVFLVLQQLADVGAVLLDHVLQRDQDALRGVFDHVHVGEDALAVEGVGQLAGKQQALLFVPAVLRAHVPFDVHVGLLLQVLEELQIREVFVVAALGGQLKGLLFLEDGQSLGVEVVGRYGGAGRGLGAVVCLLRHTAGQRRAHHGGCQHAAQDLFHRVSSFVLVVSLDQPFTEPTITPFSKYFCRNG